MRRTWRSSAVLVPLIVFAVGAAARLVFTARSPGGFGGDYGYDSGVYYASADALIHGRLPYRDYTLLHPPGLTLVLTPFAALGRLTTDHQGFVVANVAFSLLGGVNAALVSVVARRLPVGAFAAALGGLGYAVWYSSFIAEFNIRLEPLGNVLTLLGLLAVVIDRRTPSVRAIVLGGACFGAAASVKIWWLAVVAVVLLWVLVDTRSWRRAAWFAGGAAAAMVAVNIVFFAAAPRAMARMVLRDQLGRPRADDTTTSRLALLSGVVTRGVAAHRHAQVLAVCVVVAVLVAVVLASRLPAARLPAVLTVLTFVVLLAGPTLAFYYGDFLAAPLCVTGAAAIGVVQRVATARGGRAWTPVVTAAACVPVLVVAVASGLLFGRGTGFIAPFPTGRLRTVAAGTPCVMVDSPMAAIKINTLSRDLAAGCPNWVDVTGRTYDVDRPKVVDGRWLPRYRNRKWQRNLLAYLRSGDGVMVIRRDTGYSPAVTAALTAGGPIARGGRYVLFRVRH